jgi:hypothetical protein
MTGWMATSVEDVEAVPWPGGIRWHPLRMVLGMHAFGLGGYTAPQPGDVLIGPHTEDPDGRGHEELYIVLAGRATFTLDGSEFDAVAGTLVAVSDPKVHRQAVAVEAGTVVLALGAPPAFTPAGSGWEMRARPLMRSDPARAREILDDGLRELPESPAIRYGFAMLAAAEGHPDEARDLLRDAFAREPRLRDEAAGEPLLAGVLRRLGFERTPPRSRTGP